MYKRILITTTNSIHGAKIVKYGGLISTNIVVGTNLFSDFGAAITDIFGGHSESYQKKLQGIYNVALDSLRLKAENINSNAIIGLRVDFDEISGKGKSMFMISAVGTAIRVEYEESKTDNLEFDNSSVSLERLQKEITKRLLTIKIKSQEYPTEEEWEYLINNPIKEVAENLLLFYFSSISKIDFEITDQEKLVNKYFINYLLNLESELAVNLLYDHIVGNPKTSLKIIKTVNLFSSKRIKELFETGEKLLAIKCLNSDKPAYTLQDLEELYELEKLTERLEDTGTIKTVKPTMGKAKEKFICSNGHINDISIPFCEAYGCGINIKGLTKEELDIIEVFRLKTECLASLLKA